MMSINLVLYHLTSLISSIQVHLWWQEYFIVIHVIKLQKLYSIWIPYFGASLVTQVVKNLPAMQETKI